MIKDLLKTMLEITNDTNLKPSEKILLSSLILYHNHSIGYAYPNYEHLQIALSTNRKATVANTLKSLEEKGYITIKKARGNKNIYFINKHLFYVGEHNRQQQVIKADKNDIGNLKIKVPSMDCNKYIPLENKIHTEDSIKENSNVIDITMHTGFNKNQCEELLKASGNNKAKVIQAFEYMKKQSNVENEFKYTLWAINNTEKTLKVQIKNPYYNKEAKDLKFNNFNSREYDYDSLENALLGWETPKDIEEYRVYNY